MIWNYRWAISVKIWELVWISLRLHKLLFVLLLMHRNTIILHYLSFIGIIHPHHLCSFVLFSHHVNSFLGTVKVKFVVLLFFLYFHPVGTLRVVVCTFANSGSVSKIYLLIISILSILICVSSFLAHSSVHTRQVEIIGTIWWSIRTPSWFWFSWLFRWYLANIVNTILHQYKVCILIWPLMSLFFLNPFV